MCPIFLHSVRPLFGTIEARLSVYQYSQASGGSLKSSQDFIFGLSGGPLSIPVENSPLYRSKIPHP